MVAAKMPAMTKPARIAGREEVASVIKIFSAEEAVRCTVGNTILLAKIWIRNVPPFDKQMEAQNIYGDYSSISTQSSSG